MLVNSLYGMGEWPGLMIKSLPSTDVKSEMAGIEQTRMSPHSTARNQLVATEKDGRKLDWKVCKKERQKKELKCYLKRKLDSSRFVSV